LASRCGRFIPGERGLVTHWIGGWVGPRACLDNPGMTRYTIVKHPIDVTRQEEETETWGGRDRHRDKVCTEGTEGTCGGRYVLITDGTATSMASWYLVINKTN
jgi:hypothetical protein